MGRKYNIAGTEEVRSPYRGMIDSGFQTTAVYDFCSASQGRFMPCKGWESMSIPVKQSIVKYTPGRGGAERHIALFHYDDTAWKTELYIRKIQDREGAPWHLPKNIGADYIRQLTAEELMDKKNAKGQIKQYWHRTHKDNHWGDCEKMQLVIAYQLGAVLKGYKPAKAGAKRPMPNSPKQGYILAPRRRRLPFKQRRR
jgi:hypothetical protein